MIPRNKIFIHIFKLVSVLISLLLLATIPVSAQSGDSGERNTQIVVAEIYAKHFEVTIDEALHRLQLQDSFPGLSTELENNEEAVFGGLWIQHEPEYKIVVAFTDNGEQTLSKYNQYISSEVSPYIEIRNVEKSLADLLLYQDSLSLSLNEQGIKSESRVDIINNCVRIDITNVDRDKFNVAVKDNKLMLSDKLIINFVDSLSVLHTDIYGGLALCYWWGQSCCTSGFSVRNSSGTVKGITTAAHISTYLYYAGTYLPFQQGYNGGSWDCQWHTCPGFTVKNKIQWWSDGSTFNVNSKKTRSEQHVGDVVSKYGKTTHYTAGQITSTSTALASPYNYPTWIEVSNIFGYTKLSDEGDSGGPWFTGNGAGVVALGIHHSGSPDGQTAYYMAQNYLENMNVYIMTSP